jgi:hypothetical protein
MQMSEATQSLLSATYSAMHDGKWSSARRLLESLATADDLTLPEEMPDASFFGCPTSVLMLIQDRIDAVNSRAERNAVDARIVNSIDTYVSSF